MLGIVDNTYENVITINVNKCVNNGKVFTTDKGDNSGIGAIIGCTYNAMFVLNVTESGNNGEVTNANQQAAAIFGGYTGTADLATVSITDCYNTGAITAADNTAAALVAWKNGKAIKAESTMAIKNSYSSVADLALVYIDEAVAGSFPAKTEEGVAVKTVDEIAAALNNVAEDGTYYAKDGDILKCTSHEYVEGICKTCGAKDPDYKPVTPDPNPTGDMTAMFVIVALVAMAGVIVVKKKITA
jgi:hypothetical protein